MHEKNCCNHSHKENEQIKNHGKQCHCHSEEDHGHKHCHEHHGGCSCHDHEGGCSCGHDHEHGGFGAKEILLYIVGFLLLIPAFLAEFEVIWAWVGIVCAALVYFLFGKEVFEGAFHDIKRGKLFTEFTLMCVATLGAIALLEFADAAAVMFLYSLGESISGEAYRRSRKSISSLIELDEAYINIEENGTIHKKKASAAKVGDILSVRVGERISLDGVVVDGVGYADTSAVTGESAPLELLAGTECLSGSVLVSGAVSVRVTAVYEDSTVNRLRKAVKEASARKAKTEKRITRFAEIFTPLAFAVAVAVFVIGIFAYGDAMRAAKTALVILVTSCPCSLVLSVPLTYFAGLGKAAGKGIIFRGGETMDAVAAIETVVFDKTGTLTSATLDFEGLRLVTDCPFSRAELMDISAAALARSPHAAAESFCRSYTSRRKHKIESVQNIGGRGLVCLVDGKHAAFGNPALMKEENIVVPQTDKTSIYIAIDGVLCGVLEFGSRIKPDTASEVAKLRLGGVSRIAIVSGDNCSSVSSVATDLGIEEFYAECKPDEKLALLERIDAEEKRRDRRATVAFCGDGLNDSAAIMRADVGIAMGSGSALTVESADAVIVDNSVARLNDMISIARSTRRIATQNIALSLGVKLAVMLIGGLWLPSLELAIIADVGAAVLTVLNAVRAGRP